MKKIPPSPSRIPVDEDTLRTHAAFVRGVARSVAHGDADADDIAQDAWLSAIKSHAAHADAPRGWFATLVRRRGVDRVRRTQRRRTHEAKARPTPDLPGPQEIVEVEEMRALVVERVLGLEEPYRTAVLLRHYHGLSVNEVAESLGVPLETCRTRLRRGLARLRVQFEQDGTRDDPKRRGALLALGGLAAGTSALPWAVIAVAAVLLLALGGFGVWHLATSATGEAGGNVDASAALASMETDRADVAPELAGRGGAAAVSTPTKAADVAPKDGVWLRLEDTLPEGVRVRAARVTIQERRSRVPGHLTLVDLGEDEPAQVDIEPLLAGNERSGPVRKLQVRVDHDGYMPLQLDVDVPRAARSVHHGGAGRAEIPVEVTLVPAPCDVVGVVRIPSTSKASDCMLALFTEDPDRPIPVKRVDECELAEDGTFRLRAPAPGSYVLCARVVGDKGPGGRPETLHLQLKAGTTRTPEIRFSEGHALQGVVETPTRLTDGHLGMNVHLQYRKHTSFGWRELEWIVDRFEFHDFWVRLDEAHRIDVRGLGPYEYAINVAQRVGVGRDWIPTVFAGDQKFAERLEVRAPASDVKLVHPYVTWLLRATRGKEGKSVEWLSIPAYEIGRFISFRLDTQGRMAAFMPGKVPDRATHPFLGPQDERIEVPIDPQAWNTLTFRDSPTGAHLEILLPPPFAGQTDHFELSFRREQADGTEVWMHGRKYAARQGNRLVLNDLMPGTWTFRLKPSTYSGADLTSPLRPYEGTVEITPDTTTRIDVTLELGGYLEIPDIRTLAKDLGFPEVKPELVQFHKLHYRLLDARGKRVSVRHAWRRPPDPEFASLRKRKEIRYAGVAADSPLTFWPPLPTGEYVLELWTPKQEAQTKKRLPFDIQVGKRTRLPQPR